MAFTGGGYYTVDSIQKLNDIIQCKIWLALSILAALALYSLPLQKRHKFVLGLILLSYYFVILYALLYKGTDFGLNGPWGDNATRLTYVTKFRDFSSPYQSMYSKNLPPFYPPLWFFISGKLAWLFGIEGYKTIKLGYFVTFALFPILLFYAWNKIIPRPHAFMISTLTFFLGDHYLV
jgi:galactan 5-O-arabinofuranosyltransferase